MDQNQIIEFLKEIEVFKSCERTCQTTGANRAESDAEHSWHLGIFCMLLEGGMGDVDMEKILKLSLIHDLPEIYAGDTNPYRDNVENKEENEKRAAEKLFGHLPAKIGQAFSDLFQEYLEQKTPEARLVKSADKLMPLIQNLCTNKAHSSYRKLGVSYDEAKGYMAPYFNSESPLHPFYEKLLGEADTEGVFHREAETEAL